MEFTNKDAILYIPDGAENELARTTDLCIAAHADDVEIMAYSAIAACYQTDTRFFSSVTVTDGAGAPRTGAYAHFTDDEMKRVRADEQMHAADIGQYAASVLLAFPSGQVKSDAGGHVSGDIAKVLLTARAETVYTHNLFDKHDTHVATALRTIEALRRIQDVYRAEHVYMLEVWRALDWLCDCDKTLLDTTPYPTLAKDLLGVYKSQIAGGKRYDLAAIGRRLANATFLESHVTDDCESLSYALDATAFVYSDTPAEAFVQYYIDRFCTEVHDRLARVRDGRLQTHTTP